MAPKLTRPTNTFYDLWFPKNTQSITIVGPPSFDELKDASLSSPNYALMDNLGDRDSIYAIGKLLSRKYPDALIDLRISDKIDSQSLRKNLVIIGGPGGSYGKDKEAAEGNEICRLFSVNHINSRISYSDDCESLLLDQYPTAFISQFDSKGHMTRDYGYFSAFQNPLLSKSRVVMIHGIHTLGVLGATRIFDDTESDFADNVKVLDKKYTAETGKTKYNFECLFKVKVTKGEVSCPTLEDNFVFPFDKAAAGEARAAPVVRNNTDAEKMANEIITLITIAQNNTQDQDRKKEHQKLIDKIKAITSPDIGKMREIRLVCDSNPQIPEPKIEKINSLLK